jgi:chromosomal replication initiator protein
MSIEWQSALETIKTDVSPTAYLMWFQNVVFDGIDRDEAVLRVPNGFFVKTLSTKYHPVIIAALQGAGVKFSTLRYEIDASIKDKKKSVKPAREKSVDIVEKKFVSRAGTTANHTTGLNPRYRMENFIIGSNNDFAAMAAKAVIDNPGTKYNPYFIYGGPGLGKTHLIQAIGNELLDKDPNLKILYVTIEQFYSDFVTMVRNGNMNKFSEKYRKLDVLIIDDFQFIVGKERSQEEFFHTFNELQQKNKQIIVSSDRLPSQIKDIDNRLSSRLMMGCPVDVQMPNFETRCAILKAKAEWADIQIANSAIEYLAENVRTNIRELEGKFNQLVALVELRNISPEEVIENGYLNDAGINRVKSLTPEKVIEKTAEFFQIKAEEICGQSRKSEVNLPRHIDMFLLSEELDLSTTKIANELGRKDHTTAMYAIKKIKKDLVSNFSLREKITVLRGRLYEEN